LPCGSGKENMVYQEFFTLSEARDLQGQEIIAEQSFYVAAIVKPLFPFFSFLRFSSSMVRP
jgi:hypothetical protein